MADQDQVTVARAVEALGLTVQTAQDRLGEPVTGAIASDLLSYVMAQGRQGRLWLTIQTHSNVVAVAALAGLSGILISGGFQPEDEALARADEEGIPLLTSPEPTYDLAGKLWALGVR